MGRRSFVSIIIGMIHASVVATLAIPGLRVIFAPLKRKRKSSEYLTVAPLSVLKNDRPVSVTVNADRWDAFAHDPPGPIGRVWLMQSGDDDPPQVRCYQTVCPHLGCGINYAAERSGFSCPCHLAEFDLAGKVKSGPSPRGMDELACRVTEPDANEKRWIQVNFESYETGTRQKRLLT